MQCLQRFYFVRVFLPMEETGSHKSCVALYKRKKNVAVPVYLKSTVSSGNCDNYSAVSSSHHSV